VGKHLNSGVGFLEKGSPDSLDYFTKAVSEFKTAAVAWPGHVAHLSLHRVMPTRMPGTRGKAIAAYTKAWQLGKDLDAYKRVALIHITEATTSRRNSRAENSEMLKVSASLSSLRKNMTKDELVKALADRTRSAKAPATRSRRATSTTSTT